MAKKIVLAGACRTAIGTMGGELSTIPAPELGAIVIKEALKRAGVAPEAVDQVYMGCVIQACKIERWSVQTRPFKYEEEYPDETVEKDHAMVSIWSRRRPI